MKVTVTQRGNCNVKLRNFAKCIVWDSEKLGKQFQINFSFLNFFNIFALLGRYYMKRIVATI